MCGFKEERVLLQKNVYEPIIILSSDWKDLRSDNE